MSATTRRRLGFFARYLTLWVAACTVIGVLLGKRSPRQPTRFAPVTAARRLRPSSVSS